MFGYRFELLKLILIIFILNSAAEFAQVLLSFVHDFFLFVKHHAQAAKGVSLRARHTRIEERVALVVHAGRPKSVIHVLLLPLHLLFLLSIG